MGINMEPVCTVNLKLPVEYKRLFLDKNYYENYPLFRGTLDNCRSETFLIGKKKYYVCVLFGFPEGQYERQQDCFLRIQLWVKVSESHEHLVESEPYTGYSNVYDVFLHTYEEECVRVIVK